MSHSVIEDVVFEHPFVCLWLALGTAGGLVGVWTAPHIKAWVGILATCGVVGFAAMVGILAVLFVELVTDVL